MHAYLAKSSSFSKKCCQKIYNYIVGKSEYLYIIKFLSYFRVHSSVNDVISLLIFLNLRRMYFYQCNYAVKGHSNKIGLSANLKLYRTLELQVEPLS